MTQDYIIRKLTENDYIEYLELINEFRPSQFTEDQFKNTLKIINLNSDIFVIELNTKLIATATIIFEHKFIHNISKYSQIEDVCVKAEFRKNGYGKILINYLIEVSKNNNCKKINLVCNNDIIKFYESCNFDEKGIQMSYLIY
jgi:glucosamine-phosphate N-acetyltransferase